MHKITHANIVEIFTGIIMQVQACIVCGFCVYTYIHTYIHTYIYIYTNRYRYRYTHIYIYAYGVADGLHRRELLHQTACYRKSRKKMAPRFSVRCSHSPLAVMKA